MAALVAIGVLVAVLSKDDTKPAVVATTTTTTAVGQTTTTAVPVPVYGTTDCPPPGGVVAPVTTFSAAPKKCIADEAVYTATFETSEGTVVAELNQKRSPVGVNDFVFLVRNKYYDNTSIFRTDPGLDIIQGGSPHTQSNKDVGPGYHFADDPLKFKYTEGDLIYANSGKPNSSGGQLFFAAGPKVNSLDSQGSYITFGHITRGLDIVKKILALNVGTGNLGGKPSKDVIIKTVTIEEKVPVGSSTTTTTSSTTPGSASTTTNGAPTTTTTVGSTTSSS